MAFIRKTSPPPNKILSFNMKNFTGGLNNRSHVLENNQASAIQNMAFYNETIMERRKGIEAYDEVVISAPVVYQGLFRPFTDPDVHLRATLTGLYVGANKVCDLAGQMMGANFGGRFFFADGDKLRAFGKFPQTSTAPYSVVVGTPVATNTVLTVVNPPAGFTPLDNTHEQGVTKFDYTAKTMWYEPCEKEIKDTSMGSNVLPEKPKFVVVRKGRLFVSGSEKDNDNVFISDVQNPLYYPVYLPMQLPPNSDAVRGLIVYDDSVLVGRASDVYAIHGDTNNSSLGFPLFQLKKLNTHTGFANQQSVVVAHNYLFFLGNDANAYAMSTTRTDEKTLVTTLLTKNVDLTMPPFMYSMDDLRTASTFYDQDLWYVSIKDKVLIYSYRHQAWTVYEGLQARSFTRINDTLIWGDTQGRTSKFSKDTYLDYGIPYESYFTTKWFDMDNANSYKQFREFYILAHTFDNKRSDIRMKFEIDYVDVASDVKIANQISVWGKAVWGDRFITRNINASLPFILGRRGREIRITFTNGFDPNGSVDNPVDLEAYVGRKEGTLVKVLSENKYYLFTKQAWVHLDDEGLDQPMLLYQINGDFELRGKR